MDFEEIHRLSMLGYDEKTETWFVQSRVSNRLMLTRQSLARLVEMYNAIHTGNALALLEEKELRRLDESRRRHSEALRDAYQALDRTRRRDPWWILPRLLRRLCGTALRRPD